eukprot:9468651-Pyramimonas_sp.AAC.1
MREVRAAATAAAGGVGAKGGGGTPVVFLSDPSCLSRAKQSSQVWSEADEGAPIVPFFRAIEHGTCRPRARGAA